MSLTPPARPTSREELYARVRASSRTEVTLEEMRRLGFWPSDEHSMEAEARLTQREVELSRQLRALGQELRELGDPVAALKRMRKERMAQARLRREETRRRRARERHERALAWHARRNAELLYLGQGVSAGLSEARSDGDRLARAQLPPLHDAGDLAQAMGLSLQELRFLAFERRVSRISHYRRFAMAKKTGGERIISAPMPRLKRAQYWVLDRVLARVPVHPAAHGFLAGRSIVSNAAPHAGRALVVNLDLKDFFPSIAMPRVRGVFTQLGYGKQVATTLALLCTEAATEEVEVDGETFYVADGPRVLPQGAPSSPALTNILCRRLDTRLQGAAAKLGFTYTRYADDLTFSGDEAARRLAGKLLWRVRQIVADEGFTPHPHKQHVMRSHECQSVTGIVVNDKPSIERTTLRRFRATLYQVEKDGPVGKQWNGNDNVLAALEGYARFVMMVDAAKGAPLLARVRAARDKWTGAPAASAPRLPRGGAAFRALSAQGQAPWEGFWQAGPSPLPVLEKTQEQIALEKKPPPLLEKPPAVPRHAADAIDPASAAAASAGRAEPGSAATVPAPPSMNGKRWLQDAALKVLIALVLSLACRSLLPLFGAVIMAAQMRGARSPYWGRFFFLMLGMCLLALQLR